METARVTRFEVIDSTGRAYVKYDVAVTLVLQDDGQTLKVFVLDDGDEDHQTACINK